MKTVMHILGLFLTSLFSNALLGTNIPASPYQLPTSSANDLPNIILIMTDDQGWGDLDFRHTVLQTPNLDEMASKYPDLLNKKSEALAAWVADCKKDATPPNIVLILVDDLGKEWVSCYGAEEIETPHVDALARTGIRFNHVYAMPQCTPTRLTLLTGQYPFRHGWVNHWDVPRWGGGAHFDERLNPSIGTAMKEAGYATCIAGKWQIDDVRVEPDALVKAGFDAYCMWTGYETGVKASAERYHDPYIFTKEGSRTYEDGFGPDVFKDFMVDFIHEHQAEPFFIYYPMVLTHTPFVNTPDEEAKDPVGKHKAMVRYADKITGEIVEALEKEGVRENTLIVWTTDNGTTGQLSAQYKGRQVSGGKSRTLEAGICVPFIVSWPSKVAGNQVSDALVDFTDLYPTFLDVAGVKPPSRWVGTEGVSQPFDGHSFKESLWANEGTSARKWIMAMGGKNEAQLTERGVENRYVFRDRVLRNGRYKLYVNTEGEPDQFIDLVEDPAELTDLLDQPLDEARQAAWEFLMEVASLFPERDADPRYIPNPPQEWDVEVTAESQSWKE